MQEKKRKSDFESHMSVTGNVVSRSYCQGGYARIQKKKSKYRIQHMDLGGTHVVFSRNVVFSYFFLPIPSPPLYVVCLAAFLSLHRPPSIWILFDMTFIHQSEFPNQWNRLTHYKPFA